MIVGKRVTRATVVEDSVSLYLLDMQTCKQVTHRRNRVLHCLWLGVLLFLCSGLSRADEGLQSVRALIYSSTAVELQWVRNDKSRVRIYYNGQLLETLDADSYYTDRLNPEQFHHYDVVSVAEDGSRSAPVSLFFNTRDFSLPVKEIRPSKSALSSASVLSGAKLLAYSTSAVELFWQRRASASVELEVLHNGRSLGAFDSSSLFISELSSSVIHQFELRPVERYRQNGESYSVYFDPSHFTGAVYEIGALYRAHATDSDIASSASTSEVEPETSVVAQVAQSISAEASITEPDLDTTDTVNSDVFLETLDSDAPPPPPIGVAAVRAGDCVVSSLSHLSDCMNAAQGIDRINVQGDLVCNGANCCPTGGALIRLHNVSGLTVLGNGFSLLRESGQRQCSLLDISSSDNILIRDWNLDDDATDAPCVVDDRCPRMLHIRTSESISLESVTISNAKGYAVYVQEVNGFSFTDSVLRNSGVLGLYVGHDEKSSTNVRIERSTFLDNQTNAVALLGVTGSSVNSNIISNNEFRRNHWRGQWQVAPRFGTGFTGGGQVYIAQVDGLTISNNLVADGYCENCFVQQVMGSGVSGIELARPGLNSVSNTFITNNVVQNHDAWGIFVNQGSAVDSTVVVGNNQLVRNTVGLSIGGASQYGNLVQNR